MPTPQEPLYPDNPALPDWSVVNFSFDPDVSLEDEDVIEIEYQEPQKTINELLKDNEDEFIKKQCSRCKKYISLSGFSKDCFTKSGYRSRCKECVKETIDQEQRNIRTRKYREKNYEHFRETSRKWSKTFRKDHPERVAAYKRDSRIKNWSTTAVSRCRLRSKKENLPFGFTKEDISPLPEFCSVLGVKLIYDGTGDRRCWASVDRIIPSLGYITGNVRIISLGANMAKLDGIGDLVPIKPMPKPKHPIQDQPSLFDGL